MSLTSHLESSPLTPIGQFFRDHFFNTRGIVASANKYFSNFPTILPEHQDYGTVGTAIDYRIRYYFDVTPSDKFVAYTGLSMLMPVIPHASDSLDTNHLFFSQLDAFIAKIQPAKRKLELEAEHDLARYCYILALFEQVFRSSAWENSPLLQPKPIQSIDELLAIPNESIIADISALSLLFYKTFADRLDHPAVLNPTFEGSRTVGGADADFIMEDCLIEIKTSIHPKICADWLRQLLGYVILDYHDFYHIRNIGFYMARQGAFISWPIDTILASVTGNTSHQIDYYRQDFMRLFVE